MPNWRAMLAHGAELGEASAEAERLAEAIEARLRAGRPLATDAWVAAHEAALDRLLAPQRRGPKTRCPVN
ncbi:MAG: hypothetical protein ABIR25_05820 [Sphingomicrobium sp.]